MLSHSVLFEADQKDRETRSENYAPASTVNFKKKKNVIETQSFYELQVSRILAIRFSVTRDYYHLRTMSSQVSLLIQSKSLNQ